MSDLEGLKFIATFGWVLGVLVLWDLIWRSLALWKSGRHNQKVWFIFLILVNSLGLLPIIYLLFFQKDRPTS